MYAKILLLLGICLPVFAYPNNLTVQQISLASIDLVNDEADIQFDLAWDHSWRDIENWDAAWVFVKYRLVGSMGPWLHATLAASGHSTPTGASLDVSSDGKGAFVYRSANGSGTASFAGVVLRWDYGADGVSDGAGIEIAVQGIEMVYVPSGSYWLGDGENRGGSQVFGNFEAGTTGAAFQVTSENAITLGGGGVGSLGNNNEANMYCCGGQLNGAADDFNDATTQTLPAAFPKGFDAFYCMKYELTQSQYIDFMNMLSATQAARHDSTGHFVGSANPFSFYRYGLSGSHPNFTTSHPDAPVVYMSWVFAAAYADWAGLRPMTEMEFEKACRGPNVPVIGEYPWGTAGIDLSDDLTLSNIGAANEAINTGYTVHATNGNCHVRAGSQTLQVMTRVGIFAAHASNTGRVTSGATYWGIMDMGGNAWERCVSVGHPQGRAFTGNHGDGVLNGNGFANQPSWPGQFSGYVETNTGVGYRGAGFEFPGPNLERNARISSRRLATEFWDIVLFDDAMRFVRDAP